MKLLLAFGVIVTVTSLLGIYGAYVSLDKVEWRAASPVSLSGLTACISVSLAAACAGGQ